MPLFTMECKLYGVADEYFFGAHDDPKEAPCVACGEVLNAKHDRLYAADLPCIQAGGGSCGQANYNYFDETLDTQITSREQRDRVMEAKGLTEYSPDLTMKKHRDEARYIRARAKVGDPDAEVAIRKEYKTASDKRRNRLVKASLDKSFKKAGVQ